MTINSHPGTASPSLFQRGAEGVTIVASGMFAGVMLFIGITLGGFYQSLPPQQFLNWFATNNGFIQDTIPLVSMPALLGTILCTVLFWRRPARKWWVATLSCWLGVAVLTFGFFVPTNSAFAAGNMPIADAPETLALWLQIHWIRFVLGMVATAFAYMAVSRG
ncbi:anthrone oxygenase family protein [Shimia sediminis]|uniref:anthrone oxygenase family protein n=1 Tax=Shimia sediminis TaxID=2497945 RepID=UPI000F8F2C26|nr:DUF1772 domain-containing protein [Shimia sediminis]